RFSMSLAHFAFRCIRTTLVALPGLLFCTQAWAVDAEALTWMWALIAALVLFQTLLIIGLQRSRLKYKRTRTALHKSQKELEQKVQQRTESLHQTNDQLYQEIGRHEATELLLRETQEYLHSIINSMPSVIIGVTLRGFVTHWNAAAASKTDIPADIALGQHLNDVYLGLPINDD